ncbi:MAG: PmoA family protein [Sedimentisphaerales bacterium]|nr:PmoA family protein [Sedimentisphaerales bacterium]
MRNSKTIKATKSRRNSRQATPSPLLRIPIAVRRKTEHRPSVSVVLSIAILLTAALQAGSAATKPVSRLQVVPLPYDQASFRRDGEELTRYHFGPQLHRPFLFPVNGPAGRSLTRMGHPRDPQSHSHHNSVWISHHDVDGVSFWPDSSKGKIRHRTVAKFEDAGECSSLATENEWIADDSKVLLKESRQVTVLLLEDKDWLMVIDMEFKAAEKAATLGKTPFGLIGVRMAKTIGVNDGGGTIRNSEGAVNEKEIFWKRAKWVDYSGPVVRDKIEGITLFDDPNNPNHPAYFHVRNDGWMGACLTFDAPMTIQPDKPLRLRYGLYVHGGMPSTETIEKQWSRFAELGPLDRLEKPDKNK